MAEDIEIVHRDYITFNILGQEVNLISNETDYGLSTVAEISDNYHYLGSEQPKIGSAILAYQSINNVELTDDELFQVLSDNKIKPKKEKRNANKKDSNNS